MHGLQSFYSWNHLTICAYNNLEIIAKKLKTKINSLCIVYAYIRASNSISFVFFVSLDLYALLFKLFNFSFHANLIISLVSLELVSQFLQPFFTKVFKIRFYSREVLNVEGVLLLLLGMFYELSRLKNRETSSHK